jgi:hypothetical protein
VLHVLAHLPVKDGVRLLIILGLFDFLRLEKLEMRKSLHH